MCAVISVSGSAVMTARGRGGRSSIAIPQGRLGGSISGAGRVLVLALAGRQRP